MAEAADRLQGSGSRAGGGGVIGVDVKMVKLWMCVQLHTDGGWNEKGCTFRSGVVFRARYASHSQKGAAQDQS